MIETKAVAPSTFGRRHGVELLDFRKETSTAALPFALRARRSAAAGGAGSAGRTRYRRKGAGDDGVAFLAGDAAADADHQVRILLFQVLDPAEIVENLLLRLSRTEQVLNRMMSASSGLSVLTTPSRRRARRPSCPSRTLFIWHHSADSPGIDLGFFFGFCVGPCRVPCNQIKSTYLTWWTNQRRV